jgi:hypothetical protein
LPSRFLADLALQIATHDDAPVAVGQTAQLPVEEQFVSLGLPAFELLESRLADIFHAQVAVDDAEAAIVQLPAEKDFPLVLRSDHLAVIDGVAATALEFTDPPEARVGPEAFDASR